MGNTNESALFIKDESDMSFHNRLRSKRIDCIHIKSPKGIRVTSIGLCSGIESGARAFLQVFEGRSQKVVFSQSIDLISSKDRRTSFYELYKPFDMKKGKLYTFNVEVFGGPTYSYNEMHSLSTHKDLILELTRDNIIISPASSTTIRTTSHTNIWESTTSIHTIPEITPTKTKSEKLGSFKDSHGSLKTKSINDLDSNQPNPRTFSRKNLQVNTQTDLNDIRDHSRGGSMILKTPTLKSPATADDITSLIRRNSKTTIHQKNKKGTKVNQITGIVFQIPAFEMQFCC